MRIGCDVSQTGAGKAGCGYMAASVVEALARLDSRNEYVLYSSFGDFYWEKRPSACVRPKAPNFRTGLGFRRFSSAKRFWREPPADFEARLGRPDIVHSNNFFCPVGLERARLVYTLYDLSFLEHPGWSREDNRTGCFSGVFGASLRADLILSISEYSKAHFLRTFPHYPEERILVAPLASRFGPQSPQAAPEALAGIGPFWLCVGTIEPRKNHERLFEAYAAWKRESREAFPLVLAGGAGWLMDDMAGRIRELGLEEDLIMTGYVSDAELAWLYAHCLGFLYPSLFEGFGLPVLEAMSLGAPVAASNVTSIPEAAGDAAILVDPLRPDELAGAMAVLAGDAEKRRALSRAAVERAKTYSWEKTAKIALSAYETCLDMEKLRT